MTSAVMSFPPIAGAESTPIPRPPSGPKGSDPSAVASLQAEIDEMERLERQMLAKRQLTAGKTVAPPSTPSRTSAEESADFQRLLREVRSETASTLQALDQAQHQKGDLEQQVVDLAKKLKDVTHEEMSLVDRQETMAKENEELKVALAKCEEELAVQRALNDEELGMVEELATMQDERDRLRVEVATMRESVDPLNLMVASLEDEKSKLQDAKQQLEDRVRRQAAQLGGGEEMLNQAQQQIEELTVQTATKLAALEKRRADLEEQLVETQKTLLETQGSLANTEATLADVRADAAAAAKTAEATIADLKAAVDELETNLAHEKNVCEEQIGIARSDRAIIVKELRRMQEKESETQEASRQAEESATQARNQLAEARAAEKQARQAEAESSAKLQRQTDEADTQRERADNAIAEAARMKEFADEQNAAAQETMESCRVNMEIMQRKVDACADNIRKGRAESDALVVEAEKKLADTILLYEQKSADCDSLHRTIDALKQDTAKAWDELVGQHEAQIQGERDAGLARLRAELEKQDDQLNKFWQNRLDEETELHQRTATSLAELRLQFAEAEQRLQEQAAVSNRLQSSLEATELNLSKANEKCADLQQAAEMAKEAEAAKAAELDTARQQVNALEDDNKAKIVSIAALEEGREKLLEEVKYIEGKVVEARTDKLDAIADIQVRNVLLEKELVVKSEKAKLDGEEKERLERDRARQAQRLTEAGRTIDFLRSDVRRLDEERIELRETYRKDVQKLTQERDAYMDEVDRLSFVLTERNATSEEVLSRAKGETEGLSSRLAEARSMFDSIIGKLESPADGTASSTKVDVKLAQVPGAILGAAGGGGPGTVRVSVEVRDTKKPTNEFSDSEEDDPDPVSGSSSFVPKTEELMEGVSTDTWSRRQERRAKQKEEMERLRQKLSESNLENNVLTRALQDITRNLAQLRFTGEETDTLAVPKFVMENGELVPVKVKTQAGIGGVSAAGSRRTASRASTSVGMTQSVADSGTRDSADAPDSRAASRASLVDAMQTAAPSRRPPPTNYSFGPSLPPPPEASKQESADEAEEPGADGTLPARPKPTFDEVYDYATYLGIDPTMEHDLLWIAEEALCCPVPSGWTEQVDSEGNIFFHNAASDFSTYEHPMDKQYKALAAQAQADRSAEAIEALRAEILELKRDKHITGQGRNQSQATAVGTEPTSEPEAG